MKIISFDEWFYLKEKEKNKLIQQSMGNLISFKNKILELTPACFTSDKYRLKEAKASLECEIIAAKYLIHLCEIDEMHSSQDTWGLKNLILKIYKK